MLPSHVSLHCAKNQFNNVNRYKFEDIVQLPNPLEHLIDQAGGLQERGTGFHEKFISA